jgi:4,5-DOPA dioxygenase extradiol
MATVKTRLPAIFFGHGNPMNALENNRYASAWAGCVSMLAAQFGPRTGEAQ